MKAMTLVVFAVMLVAVSCRPDLKQLKANAALKKACMRDCSAVKFDPVCAGKPGDKPKSFGNSCVLSNHNCEHGESGQQSVKGDVSVANRRFQRAETPLLQCVARWRRGPDAFQQISKGVCPGSDGIRLS